MPNDGRRSQQKQQAIAIAEALSNRFHEPLTLQDLAAETGLSVFQICRVFRAHFGASVRQHLLALRLDAAVEALLDTDASVTAIAHNFGFSSHSHLTALTTRLLGAPPSTLRRKAPAVRKILKARRAPVEE